MTEWKKAKTGMDALSMHELGKEVIAVYNGSNIAIKKLSAILFNNKSIVFKYRDIPIKNKRGKPAQGKKGRRSNIWLYDDDRENIEKISSRTGEDMSTMARRLFSEAAEK